MNKCNLNCRTNHTGECQVVNDYGLDLDESCGHVVPDIDQIKDSTSNKFCEIWVWLEASRKTH